MTGCRAAHRSTGPAHLRRRLVTPLFVAVLAAPFAAPLQGQGSAEPGRVLVETRPGAAGVAVSVRFPAGALDDPGGSEGTAFMLGRVVEAEAERRVASLSARAHVEVGLQATTVTLFAPSDAWLPAWREVAALLTDAPLPESTVAAARERIVDELIFQSGAPVRAFDTAWRGLRLSGTGAGSGNPARPPQGTVQGVSTISASTLEAFRARHLGWGSAVVAVVGNASLAEVAELGARSPELVAELPSDTARAPAPVAADTTAPVEPAAAPAGVADPAAGTEALPAATRRIAFPPRPLTVPPSEAGGARAWTAGERQVIDEEITSTWIGVAWALPPDTPWVLADFLSHVVAESLNPSPPDPGLYRADVRLEEAGGARLLVITATVDPQSAVAWEARILETLEGVAFDPPPGAFFELTRRRYRSERLLTFADPALRARWLTARAADGSTPPVISVDSWGLTREALAALAALRGEPRILLYGSVRMMALPDS